jgi:hypothetical protein
MRDSRTVEVVEGGTMNHLEAIQQLSLERRRQFRQEAEAERLAVQARGQRQQRRRRLALNAALGRLVRGRGEQTQQSAPA